MEGGGRDRGEMEGGGRDRGERERRRDGRGRGHGRDGGETGERWMGGIEMEQRRRREGWRREFEERGERQIER